MNFHQHQSLKQKEHNFGLTPKTYWLIALTFFGGGFGQGSTGTGGSTYGGGYSSQNGGSSYQRNTYTSYTTDKSKYYTILGVNKNASQDEIKKAYHKLAKQHHPDRFVNSSDSEKKYHESKMKEINDAYENLTK